MHATWPHQYTQRRLRLSSPSTAMRSYCHYSGKGGHAVKSSMRPSPAGPSARTARSAGSHCQTLFACRRPAEFSGPGPTHLPMSRDTKDPAHSSKTRIWPSLSLATARLGPAHRPSARDKGSPTLVKDKDLGALEELSDCAPSKEPGGGLTASDTSLLEQFTHNMCGAAPSYLTHVRKCMCAIRPFGKSSMP